MNKMVGVVIDLASWYVPTVLYCNERLVNTTKPQNEAESGSIFLIKSLLGEKTSIHAQSWRPSDVTMKCTRVSDMLGKLKWT